MSNYTSIVSLNHTVQRMKYTDSLTSDEERFLQDLINCGPITVKGLEKALQEKRTC